MSDRIRDIKDEELDKVSGGRPAGDSVIREKDPGEMLDEPAVRIHDDHPHLRGHLK
jgi:methyl coenzyme M reductase gamma subunit